MAFGIRATAHQTLPQDAVVRIGIDRVRSLVSLATTFGNGTISQIVLGPPYTRGDMIGGADVLLPDWSQILPLVRRFLVFFEDEMDTEGPVAQE